MVTRSTPRVVGPAHEQRLQDASDRALADRDAARKSDDVRGVRVELPEERLGHDLQLTRRREPEVEQPRERQEHVFDFLERHGFVATAQRREVVFVECQRCRGAQSTPLLRA